MHSSSPTSDPAPAPAPRPGAALPRPTPYPDVNAALRELLAGAQTVLGDHFQGMYLSGSLALGDFDPDRSDIDVVVVTDADVAGDLLAALQAMHARFAASDSPWATEVEAAYIPRDALRRYDPAHACHPHLERGAGEVLDLDQLGSDWVIQRHILREHGAPLAGPPVQSLIDRVRPEEMRRAVATLMEQWWGPMRQDPMPLRRWHIGYQVYTVLTMCRVLYTLDAGAVASKQAAARWAQRRLGERWSVLIARALAWRKDSQDMPESDVSATLDLIQYTLSIASRHAERTTEAPESGGSS